MGEVAERLRDGTGRVAVWGAGFVGFSTAASYAYEGIRTVCFDVNPAVVDAINRGQSPVAGLEFWLGFPVAALRQAGLLEAAAPMVSAGFDDLVAHFVGVPTEQGNVPWLEALWDVVGCLKRLLEPGVLVVLESTLVPGTAAKVAEVLGSDSVVVAPRRDWFVGPDKSLKRLPRVYGVAMESVAREAEALLGIVCERLYRAHSPREAELVKAVENAYRHVQITLANQLTCAYPDVDMNHVMELAATKWNFGEAWKCSIGISGYCLPVAGPYLLAGAAWPAALTLLEAAQVTDLALPDQVARALAGYRRVAILGLSYKPELHVHQMAVGIRLAEALVARGHAVVVHDPLCTPDERGVGGRIEFADRLEALGADAVVLATGHRAYRTLRPAEVRRLVGSARLVLDNAWAWSAAVMPPGVRYVRPGDAGWLAALER